MSEYGGAGAGAFRTPLGMESRKDSMNLKKALWSSTPSYFTGDISQSRRHSFANMPTRQGSISSIADSVSTLDANPADGQQSQGFVPGYSEGPGFPGSTSNRTFPLQSIS